MNTLVKSWALSDASCPDCGATLSCQSCLNWLIRIELLLDQPHRRFVADGHYYTIEPESSLPTRHLGFGGTKYLIRFNDGHEVETCNLWSGGRVPDRFVIDDTAKRIDPRGDMGKKIRAKWGLDAYYTKQRKALTYEPVTDDGWWHTVQEIAE